MGALAKSVPTLFSVCVTPGSDLSPDTGGAFLCYVYSVVFRV